MSSSPIKEEVTLRRSTRKSVAAKVEEVVVTPKKRKSTATPLKPTEKSETVGTPRRTRQTWTPRKSLAEVSSTPSKTDTPKKKESATPRKSGATPRRSVAVASVSPPDTTKETNKRTPRKSLKVTKEPTIEEECPKESKKEVKRSTRKSLAASTKKKVENSPEDSIKDTDSLDEDSVKELPEPKKKNRKSVHFKIEVDENQLEPDSEFSESPTSIRNSSPEEIYLSTAAIVPRVVLNKIDTVIKHANPAEYVIEDNTESENEAQLPTESNFDKIMSPSKFLQSPSYAEKISEADLESTVSKNASSSNETTQFLNDTNSINSDNEYKSPRRKLSYELPMSSQIQSVSRLVLESTESQMSNEGKNIIEPPLNQSVKVKKLEISTAADTKESQEETNVSINDSVTSAIHDKSPSEHNVEKDSPSVISKPEKTPVKELIKRFSGYIDPSPKSDESVKKIHSSLNGSLDKSLIPCISNENSCTSYFEPDCNTNATADFSEDNIVPPKQSLPSKTESPVQNCVSSSTGNQTVSPCMNIEKGIRSSDVSLDCSFNKNNSFSVSSSGDTSFLKTDTSSPKEKSSEENVNTTDIEEPVNSMTTSTNVVTEAASVSCNDTYVTLEDDSTELNESYIGTKKEVDIAQPSERTETTSAGKTQEFELSSSEDNESIANSAISNEYTSPKRNKTDEIVTLNINKSPRIGGNSTEVQVEEVKLEENTKTVHEEKQLPKQSEKTDTTVRDFTKSAVHVENQSLQIEKKSENVETTGDEKQISLGGNRITSSEGDIPFVEEPIGSARNFGNLTTQEVRKSNAETITTAAEVTESSLHIDNAENSFVTVESITSSFAPKENVENTEVEKQISLDESRITSSEGDKSLIIEEPTGSVRECENSTTQEVRKSNAHETDRTDGEVTESSSHEEDRSPQSRKESSGFVEPVPNSFAAKEKEENTEDEKQISFGDNWITSSEEDIHHQSFSTEEPAGSVRKCENPITPELKKCTPVKKDLSPKNLEENTEIERNFFSTAESDQDRPVTTEDTVAAEDSNINVVTPGGYGIISANNEELSLVSAEEIDKPEKDPKTVEGILRVENVDSTTPGENIRASENDTSPQTPEEAEISLIEKDMKNNECLNNDVDSVSEECPQNASVVVDNGMRSTNADEMKGNRSEKQKSPEITDIGASCLNSNTPKGNENMSSKNCEDTAGNANIKQSAMTEKNEITKCEITVLSPKKKSTLSKDKLKINENSIDENSTKGSKCTMGKSKSKADNSLLGKLTVETKPKSLPLSENESASRTLPLGKRSPLRNEVSSKVTTKRKKIPSKDPKKLLSSSEDITVSDVLDIEGEKGEEISSSCSTVSLVQTDSVSSNKPAFDFGPEKKIDTQFHIGSVDFLFSVNNYDDWGDEDDSDWMPPAKKPNILESNESLSTTIGKGSTKKNTLSSKSTISRLRKSNRHSKSVVLTKSGLFSTSVFQFEAHTDETAIPRGFTVEVSNNPTKSISCVPKNFTVTSAGEDYMGNKENYPTEHRPNSQMSSNLKEDKNTSKKSPNETAATQYCGIAVFPFRLKQSEIIKSFREIGVQDIVSVQYTNTTTARIHFSTEKSLKKALNLYGQIIHNGKPIYVLAENTPL